MSFAKSSPAWCEERVSGACRNESEALGVGDRLEALELLRRDEANDRMVLARWCEILPDGEEIDLRGTQIVHELQDLVALLAEPDHDPGFGEQARIELFGALQQAQRVEIARARPHAQIFGRHRLEIMVEDVGLASTTRLERALFSQEIRRQHLDCRLWRHGADGGGSLARNARRRHRQDRRGRPR